MTFFKTFSFRFEVNFKKLSSGLKRCSVTSISQTKRERGARVGEKILVGEIPNVYLCLRVRG